MGADARWVCNTCKTVCSRGGTPIFKSPYVSLTLDEVKDIASRFSSIMQTIELITDDESRYTLFLKDLTVWLKRHENHSIHVGSDYTTDGMDLDDYRNEDVDGNVSSLTRHEADMSCFDEWSESSIRDIQQAIEEYASNQEGMSSREVAEELFNRYGMRV